jgi:hypothetical protein
MDFPPRDRRNCVFLIYRSSTGYKYSTQCEFFKKAKIISLIQHKSKSDKGTRNTVDVKMDYEDNIINSFKYFFLPKNTFLPKP